MQTIQESKQPMLDEDIHHVHVDQMDDLPELIQIIQRDPAIAKTRDQAQLREMLQQIAFKPINMQRLDNTPIKFSIWHKVNQSVKRTKIMEDEATLVKQRCYEEVRGPTGEIAQVLLKTIVQACEQKISTNCDVELIWADIAAIQQLKAVIALSQRQQTCCYDM
jgi:hypothetical protein